MPARTLAPKEVDTRRCANEGPDGGDEIPHRLKRGTSVIEDSGLRRRVDREILHQLERRMKHSL